MYFSFDDMLKTNKNGGVPYTPILPLLHGLKASLGLLNAEGLDNVFARHHRCGAARQWCRLVPGQWGGVFLVRGHASGLVSQGTCQVGFAQCR